MSEPVVQRPYFDANALVKYYHDEKGSLNIRRLVSNTPTPIMVSSLTILECISVVMGYYRKGFLKQKHFNSIFQRLRKDAAGKNTPNRPFEIIPIPEKGFRLAENILFQYARIFQISSNDALHLTIVKEVPSPFSSLLVTSDKSMQKVCERLCIPFYDPEIEE